MRMGGKRTTGTGFSKKSKIQDCGFYEISVSVLTSNGKDLTGKTSPENGNKNRQRKKDIRHFPYASYASCAFNPKFFMKFSIMIFTGRVKIVVKKSMNSLISSMYNLLINFLIINYLCIAKSFILSYILFVVKLRRFYMMTQKEKLVVRPSTAKLVARLIAPLMDSGLVTVNEYQTITASINHIAKHGTPVSAIQPKLITGQEASELLGISYSGFRSIENTLPVHRRVIGKSIRYYLPEIVTLMESNLLFEKGGQAAAI